jgi:hypothetical protein
MEQSESRDKQGKFVKGASGNPAGRRPATREARAMLDAAAPALIQRIIEAAQDKTDPAYPVAMKLVADRLVAPVKAMHFMTTKVDAPEVLAAADLPSMLVALTRATVDGRIPVDVLPPIAQLVAQAVEATHTSNVERRLQALEQLENQRARARVSNSGGV